MKIIPKIDIHVHTTPEALYYREDRSTYATPLELRAIYDTIGVEKALLLPSVNEISNREARNLVRDYPQVLGWWFANFHVGLDHNDPEWDWTDRLRDLKSQGAKGIGEICENRYFDDPLVLNMFKYAEKEDMPITFHIGDMGKDYGLVTEMGLGRLEKVLAMFPKLKFLGHSQKFWADPLIPRPYRVDFYDYRAEWDRGHMCPAGDNKWSQQAMYECFYMSNMCPQDHILNTESWEKLESACRRWAQSEGAIYIVCGPVYKNVRHLQIGQSHKVDVPEGFFKAVLSTQKGREKAIAFYFDNNSTFQDYKKIAVSVDAIEEIIGIDLFADLDDTLEDRIEAKANIRDWKK